MTIQKMKRFSQTLKNTLPMTTLVRNIPKTEKNHGDILQKTMLLYKSITEIIGLGTIGIGIIGIFTEIEIIGDTDGAFVMVFTETMCTSLFIMDITETIFTTVFITILTIIGQTTEIEDIIDILIIEMQEIIHTIKEIPPQKGGAPTPLESNRTAMLDEMPLPSIIGYGQTTKI